MRYSGKPRSILLLIPLVIIAFAFACGESTDHVDREELESEINEFLEQVKGISDYPEPDMDKAERGSDLFITRRCATCHTIGRGRRSGPDLAGVTQRREYDWLVRMILVPEEMVETDPEAERLSASYRMMMPNQLLKPSEVESIIMYLMQRDADAGSN